MKSHFVKIASAIVVIASAILLFNSKTSRAGDDSSKCTGEILGISFECVPTEQTECYSYYSDNITIICKGKFVAHEGEVDG